MKLKYLPLIYMLIAVSNNSYANNCEIPLNELTVGDLRIGESIDRFRENHRTKTIKDIYTISLIDEEGNETSFVDEKLKDYGITQVTNITYNPRKQVISSYGLGFNDGKYANLDTPINVFKKYLLTNFSLPQNNWKKTSKYAYRYQCDDYYVEITQDYGIGRTTTGPGIVVMTKLMPNWDYWKKQ